MSNNNFEYTPPHGARNHSMPGLMDARLPPPLGALGLPLKIDVEPVLALTRVKICHQKTPNLFSETARPGVIKIIAHHHLPPPLVLLFSHKETLRNHGDNPISRPNTAALASRGDQIPIACCDKMLKGGNSISGHLGSF